MPDKDELLETIGNEIINSEDARSLDWQYISIIVDVSDGAISNEGYAYLTDRIEPIIASSTLLDGAIWELRSEIKVSGKKPFSQMLIQIRFSDKKMKVYFEYNDSFRWTITPKNIDKMKEELRPTFESTD